MLFNKAAIASTLIAAPLAYAQSSAASAAASGASAASSAAAPSGSAAAGNGTQYLEQVLGALTSAGLTSLVTVASSIANTTEGMELLGSLAVGNKTVFAPNNDAFSAVPESVSSNTTLLTQILSYHILNNTYSGEGIAVGPNHTIARTLLRSGEFALPNNRSQPLVLERESANATGFRIIQSEQVTAQNPVNASNLQVYVIDRVLDLPANITTVANETFPALSGVITQSGLLEPLEQAEAVTIFAPSDEALQSVQGALGSLNETQVQNLLLNHVINGTAVYSNQLSEGNYTSAAGEPFTFMRNDTGVFVMSGNASAQITASDIIINNGVVHLIGAVLVNTESDTEAASSAYESATSAAGTQVDPTGPITATSQPAQSGGNGGSGGGASSTPSGAAGRLSPLGLTGSMIGGAIGVIAAVAGGAFVLV